MQKPKTPIYKLDIAEVLDNFGTSKHGLNSREVQKRQAQFGRNQLPERKVPIFKRLIEPFANAFVAVLLFALLLSVLEGRPVDATIIAIIVGVNAIIFYIQQYSVSRVLQTLRQHDVTLVPVVREGRTIELRSEELTYGDIVHINEGMKIPADGRIIDATQLECDEAILTGESLPVHKHAAALTGDELPIYHQKNMVFKGTYAKSGSGLFVVTGIGSDTQLGAISTLVSQAETGRSPIERKIDKLIRQLIVIIGLLASLTLLLASYRGVAFEEALRFSLVIVVSAIPEGLPIALTIVLLLSARRMARLNALVKKIASIETMGAITLIATDKTGTITENKLSVADKHTTHPTTSTFDQMIRSSLNVNGDHPEDSLDQILESSVAHTHTPASWRHVHDFAFDQDLRLSGVVWRREHDFILIIKGAPESVLEHCEPHHKTDTKVQHALSTFTGSGYRTIAFAHRMLDREPTELNRTTLQGMIFDGFVGMSDTIRPGVAEAVQEAQRAGIHVVMLTGDHVATAGFIAQQVGIAKNTQEVADSSVLQAGNVSDIRDSLKRTRVYGRVLPEHKYALLKATKDYEITAMTGDGVNDIPALVGADAGIAMGSSSDAAKDASDIVLLDNNFHTIVAAIRVGRTALANVRKMVVYLLGTSSGEVLTMLLALVFNLPLPVAAVQILWINLVTDGATVIPLGLSPSEERQMLATPRSPRAALLDFRQVSRIALMGITMSATILIIYVMNLPKGHMYAQTLAFLSLIVIQWANALNANYEYKSWVYNFIRPNFTLLAAIAGSIILQLFVFLTPVGHFLGVTKVEMADAVIAIIVPAVVMLLIVDLHKLVFHHATRHRKVGVS